MVFWSLMTLILGCISYVSLSINSNAAMLMLPKIANVGVMLVSLGIIYRVWWEKRQDEISKLKNRVNELEKKVIK